MFYVKFVIIFVFMLYKFMFIYFQKYCVLFLKIRIFFRLKEILNIILNFGLILMYFVYIKNKIMLYIKFVLFLFIDIKMMLMNNYRDFVNIDLVLNIYNKL